jgi:hypothetical protein
MKLITTLASGLFLVLTSCSEEKQAADSPAPQKEESLSAVLLDTAPADPVDIAEMRKSAKPGEAVTFTGSLIGKNTIFMDNRAVMVMGDPKKLTACNLIPGDECETPWDVCCDDYELIKDSIVTVQVVDEDGKPLQAGLKGLGGMAELSAVTVTGEVAEGSSAENMVVNASGIFVQPKSS